ncbi:MAG: adenylosuccinate synthase [Peptococcaceae bacterium]|jgi:adenylosuccinate synthase|nr:MAG: adenylosuccinate synthase [Peptococcaceae bacterium]
MAAVVLVGAQWGDEGKGKVTDFLAEKADLVVRYQGGNNAGHTVVVGDQEFRLHLIPSGILYPGRFCLLGSGVVIDPEVLIGELDSLSKRDIDTSGLRISQRAHVIFPYHRRLDQLDEERKGNSKIGTTCRGIGPAYIDKSARIGIRMIDLIDREELAVKLERNLREKNSILENIYGEKKIDFEEMLALYSSYGERLERYVADTSLIINDALSAGKNVLFEGAQGTLLDLDHGTYPFVTSSHPTAGAACLGAGIGPAKIGRVIGVTKAYSTRVGEGPYPTELAGELCECIRRQGCEYGTTTGRPRRCGWFDGVAVRYAVRINGLDYLAVTKLDVLSGLEKIMLCTGYRYRGEIINEFPASLKVLSECEPIYEEHPGWAEDISTARCFEDLPVNARRYLERISAVAGAPTALISVGSKRSQTIVMTELF